MREYLEIVAAGRPLTGEQAAAAMTGIMSGDVPEAQTAAFLVGVTARGPTVGEILGFTRVLRNYAIPVAVADPDAIDLCGTGGDGGTTFNVSTAAVFVCAGAGLTVAKHGNRSVSSQCGSADVLEALGVNTELNQTGVEYCLSQTGIGFIFAPLFHPAMKHVMPARRALGVRTFFNILGPLCNPAGVRRQLIGAYSEQTAALMADVLKEIGADHVITVHSEDGLDEVSLLAPSVLFEYVSADQTAHAGVRRYVFDPATYGLDGRVEPADLSGGDATANAAIINEILDGRPSPKADIVLLNAAHGIVVGGKATGIEDALQLARDSISSGAARAKLDALREASKRVPTAR